MAFRTSRCLAACALAMTVVTPARADDSAIAEKLFLEGHKLMGEGRYPAACEKFKAAHDLDAAATGTLLNLALCHEQIKKNATAWAEFRQVIAESSGRREDRVAIARNHEAKLAPLLSFVIVHVPPTARVTGLRIDLDRGHPVAEASWDVKLPVDPGMHVLAISAPGKVGRTVEVTVGDTADEKTVEVPVLADVPREVQKPPTVAPTAPVEESNGQRTVGYVLGGVGVAALSVGLISGAIALNRRSDADEAAARCPSGHCASDEDRKAALDTFSTANTFANVANVGVGAGVALLAAGIVLVVTARSHPSPKAVTPILRATAAGVAVSLGNEW